MAYLLYNDKYYIEKTGGGKFSATSNIDKAFRASSEVLQSYINNQISKKERPLYKIIDDETDSLPTKDKLGTPMLDVSTIELSEEHITDVVDKLFNIIRENKVDLNLLAAYIIYMREELSHVSGEITDYYHYIEFNDLSASSGFKVYKDLKQTLIHRRKLKDTISKLDLLMQTFKDNSEASFTIFDYIEPNDRSYTARELPELFE